MHKTLDEEADEPPHRKAARYVWALLMARIYEVLPLVCPKCGGDMRIIAFINEGPVIRETLGHLGEPISAPRLAPVHGPPLWALPATEQAERETDPQAQPAPDYEFDGVRGQSLFGMGRKARRYLPWGG